jgi:PKD domain
MASLGAGVNLDASAPPVRMTFFDTSAVNPDVQDDGSADFWFDIHKIWACMGRVGVNGVMRSGLVEIGDSFNGWPAAWIEANVGGVFGGVNLWNTVTGYSPSGGLAAGDYTIFGALAPFPGIALHIQAALGAQPEIQYAYWTGAWTPTYATIQTVTNGTNILNSPAGAFGNVAAGMSISGPDIPIGTTIVSIANPNLTMSNVATGATAAIRTFGSLVKVPDFTKANGKLVQRLESALPVTPVWLSAVQGTAPGPYYFSRLLNIAAIGAAPASNFNYKDWLYGHFKFFYCHYGLKRGDDGVGSAPTAFKHEGDFSLQFRQGFGLETRTQQIDPIIMGKRYAGGEYSSGKPWFIYMAPDATRNLNGVGMYGGLIAQRQKHDSLSLQQGFFGNAGFGELIDVMLAGGSNYAIGAAGTAVLGTAVNVEVTKNPLSTQRPVASSNISTRAEGIKVAIPPGAGTDIGLRSTIVDARFDGLEFTSDSVSVGQIEFVGGGIGRMFNTTWGGPNLKSSASVTFLIEIRRVDFSIRDGELSTAPPAGMPIRISDPTPRVQATGVLDANGACSFQNSGPWSIPFTEINPIVAEEWKSGGINNVLDQYLTIEINPSDLAGYNPMYETRVLTERFPRRLMYDPADGTFKFMEWQRDDLQVALGLSLIDSPTAGFSYSPKSGGDPLTVAFTDESSGQGITTWLWDFGDGSTSSLQSPPHQFGAPGFYVVTLTVTNAAGSDSQQAAVNVLEATAPLGPEGGYSHRAIGPTSYAHRP